MSVEIDPTELGFYRPFTTEVSQILKIKNPNQTPIAFKVKTTAPKQYCVRPNSGRIEPGKAVEVTVLLQAMKQEPPLDAKCRDKFLVQSVALTADKEFGNIADIWTHVDNADKSSVAEKKIKVVFLPVGGASSVATPQKNGIVNGTSSDSLGASAYRSPSPETFTPQQSQSAAAPVGPVSTFHSKPAGNKDLGDAKASSFNPATSSTTGVKDTVTSAISSAAATVPTTMEELKIQLADAQAKIASLAGGDGGLRQRKTGSGSGTTTTTESRLQPTSSGVPVQIVAALCFLSFLLAYLLF